MTRDLKTRALAAFHRYPRVGDGWNKRRVVEAMTEVIEHDGRTLVVLANGHRTLAIYQQRADGALRRLL